MIRLANISFIYDPDGQFMFPLALWIAEIETQCFLGMDFYQMQVYRLHFDLPGFEIKNPPNFFCYGSFHLDKYFPYLLQRSSAKAPFTMCIDAKSGLWWKNSPEETHKHFAPGSTFQPKRNGFINTLCTGSKRSLPMVIENNKNHQITIPIGRIGFPSFDVVD